jgi:photosystem II stability/assembly factor-like uncharacterized protein
MKAAKHILLLVIISLFTSSTVYAQWEKLIVNGDTRVFNIFTVNNNLFVFTGPTGGSYPPTQILLSTDDGNSFTNLSQSLPDSVTGLYTIEWHNGITFLGTDNGIYASSDLGSSWIKKNKGINSKYNYSLTSDGDYLYAGFTGSIYRSNDNGDNWEMLELPLNLQLELSIIRQIERSDSTLYVLSGNTPMNIYKLKRTFDEFSMSKLFTGNSIRDFSVNKSGSNITIAKFYSSGESGIFHSNDYGNSFELDPNFINVNAYSIHQVGETEFVSFFGSQGRAISYRNQSTNNVWTNTNEDIYSTRIDDITSNDTYLFVSHADSVISRIKLSHFGITTDVESLNEIPQNFLLSQNYPNPFNPSTKINFSIPKQTNVSLKVYDVLGKEVAELVNTEMSNGSYKINFNADNLSSGIYFYTLKTNEFISTRKMLLVK